MMSLNCGHQQVYSIVHPTGDIWIWIDTVEWYCNALVGSIHDGTLLHSKFNTQLLITTLRTRPNSTSSLTQLHQITTGASNLFKSQTTTAQFIRNLSLIYHTAITITITVLIVALLRKCNRAQRSCYQGNLICNNIYRGKPKNSERNLSQCRFIHQQSYMEWAGVLLGPSPCEARD
jgi:hypothetical protein